MKSQSREFERDSVLVRDAEERDVPVIAALAKRTWADAFGDSVGREDLAAELQTTRSEEYFRGAMQNETILVAELDGSLVGYVQFGDVNIPEIEVEPGDQELHRVYVETDLQRRGIGRKLMNAALSNPRLASARRVFLAVWEKNQNAIALYESLGFRTVGKTRFTIGNGEVAEDLVMVLDKSAELG